METSVHSGDLLASFPGGKPENEDTLYPWQCSVVATFVHAHSKLKWRPTPRQLLECLASLSFDESN